MRALGWWLVILVCLPAVAVGTEAITFVGHRSVLAPIERAVGPVCHHLPGRTLVALSRPLPVCARCTGLWTGAAVAGLVGLALPSRRDVIGRGMVVGASLTTVGLVAALVETIGLVGTSNGIRLVLGLALGAGLPLIAGIGARLLVRGRLDG